jgi:hypothetical protein
MIISRESIFKISFVKTLPFFVVFEQNSESYLNYGQQLLLEAIYSDKEVEELIINYYCVPTCHTFGKIKAVELINDTLPAKQKIKLSQVGFNTCDIQEIVYR